MSPLQNNEVDETGMPPEVHQYYQAEHRERVGIAWLLAFATLVITVGVALGAFFGGRGIYRSHHKKNQTPQVATKNQTKTETQSSASNSSNSTSDTSEPSNSNNGQVSQQAANTTKPTPKPKPTPAPITTTNPSLVDTGPQGND
ncbi:MAG TPA: hypothetical protein VLF39_04050 [Candidatus Saccharimonadales bacterium]|nr:hypothetical protein [Candidatus Saccharimonadales bacterium]